MELAALLVGGFSLFCNGYVVAETESREEEHFWQKWEGYVNESQDTKMGKNLMKIFYIIPNIRARISLFQYKLEQNLDKKSL